VWKTIGILLGVASAGTPAVGPQPSGLVPPPRVLDCANRVEGPARWPPPGWRRDAVQIGPITFVGLRAYASEGPDGFPGVETVAMVRAERQVTIRIHGPTLVWPGTEGRRAVTFVACPRRERLWSRAGHVGSYTQFNGGFRAKRPQCARIDVWVGQRERPLRRYLELGSRCPPHRPPESPPSDAATGLVPPPPVLTCGNRVETGRGFPPHGWRRTSVRVGPLALYNLRANARASNGTAETVALVKAGHQVTLNVPPLNRPHLSLLFGPATNALTFKACGRYTRRFSRDHRRVGRYTLFQGGVGGTEPQCAPLDFWPYPRRHPTRRYVAFGRRC
jgi:hypothetical protein